MAAIFIPPYCKKQALLSLLALLFFTLSFAQNPIVTENALPGNPSTEWDIAGAGDLSIQGFATDISVNKGQTVHFKIQTDASAYSINIYRLGYYNGNGAKLKGTGIITAVLPQVQPAPLTNATTGLVDCGNWNESAHWDVPSTAVSGIYIARLKRTDNGGASHIVFIVRDDASNSDLLFQASDATWQAYNSYGGNSLYLGTTALPSGHASKVSYNRPFTTRAGGGGGGIEEDWLFNAEYPMIRFLEKNGYNVTYTTNIDAARYGNLILNHKVYLSVGHDEYWSAEQKANVTAARNAGVHLAFFSGNEVYWKTRWENSTDPSNTPYRTLVCYKEGTLGESVCGGKCDPSTEWTGLWRDGCGFPAGGGCSPENSLTGQISWQGSTAGIEVPSAYKNLRFWRNTSIASLGNGDVAVLPNGTLGYEWNFEHYGNSYPNGRITLSSTTIAGKTHKLSLYRHSSGALVFGAGTVQYAWGLDDTHDGGNTPASPDLQQATVNLFADMGVQPGSIQPGLSLASQSSDTQAPVTTITSPIHNATVSGNTPVIISGTSSDANTVAGVEISVDGGVTWNLATGTTSWSFSWAPASTGTFTIKVRGFDDSGNLEVPGGTGSSNNITVVNSQTCACISIFQPTDVPANVDNNIQPLELGVKFRTTNGGYITGIRFYKGAGTTGTHIGHLWTSTGTMLGEATFTAETSSGWQQVLFSSPIAIAAGTTYVASYHSSSGKYANTVSYFTQAVVNGPIKALADNEDGPNGVYIVSPTSAFPVNDYQASNYWVDVILIPAPDINPPVVSSVLPLNGSMGTSIYTSVTATFNEPLDASTVNSSTFELRDASNALVPAVIAYNISTQTATITPSTPLAHSTLYTAKLKGGVAGAGIKDVAGNALLADYTWSFTTVASPIPPNSGHGGPILVTGTPTNPFSRYAAEILRAEGLNEFASSDISAVTAGLLNNYDVVILGEVPVTPSQVVLLTNWVNAGGTLIAFKPSDLLAPLLGISPALGSISDKYLLVNTASGPGTGIVNQSIQFHGSANLHTLIGATSLATLYSNSTTATTNPAVTKFNVGVNGGSAIAFTYDLAKSIVYTRQGNPAWAGMERDGEPGPIRTNDLYFGNAVFDPQPDWVDFSKIDIPQADEQQRFLANIILQSNLHRKPLPRFWYLPRGLKAAIVMTGDDHAINGTAGRFNHYLTLGPNTAQDVADWKAIRGTSYMYANTPITPAEASSFEAQGFEIALHPNTGCADFTPASLENNFSTQLPQLASIFPGISAPVTNRTHCLPWSDWVTQAKIQAAHGIRLDVNYYYWPGTWIQNRAGMFTGSGIPMRFADLDGTLIDCYQAPTQMTDESGIDIDDFCDALLDKALGTEGYYGVFTANMHTDIADHAGSNAIIASAQARQVPVISAKQMLTWLDGRNNSFFGPMVWNNNQLSFSITASPGSNNLKAMVPFYSQNGQLSSITRNGNSIAFTTQTIKGMFYAFFDAALGNHNYVAVYTPDNIPPAITNIVATPYPNGTATITWTTNEPSTSHVDYGVVAGNLNLNANNNNIVISHTITLTGLTLGTTYYFRVTSTDGSNNSATEPIPANAPLSFTMPPAPCVNDITAADFNLGTTDANTIVALDGDGVVTLKPAVIEEFSGNTIPAGWGEGTYNPGMTTVSNGSVTVDGTHIFSNDSYGPGTSLEFVATFNHGAFQNVGFTVDQPFNGGPWVTIGQGIADGNVYARTSDGTAINIGTDLLGSAHRYRISWNANNFEIYVDGNNAPAATINMPVAVNMYLQISDYANTDGSLSVDWIRVAPYAATGSFISRVFDGGVSKDWGSVQWNSDVPAGTSLAISVRTGNTATPDGTWSAYTTMGTSGASLGDTGRYVQYKADFMTTDTKLSASLKNISIFCSAINYNVPPTIIIHPGAPIPPQPVCIGSTVSLTSSASGTPTPTVQWQVSVNGTTWSNIIGATTSTLSFTATGADDGKIYRAVWSNIAGVANSSSVTLDVLTPTITGFTNNSRCSAGTVVLGATASSGLIKWYASATGGSPIGTGTTFTTPSILVTTSYWVDATEGGCTSAPRTQVTATINALPAAGITNHSGTTILTCTGVPINVTATGGVSYSWNGGATPSTANNSFTSGGTYTVTVTGANGCSSTASIIITQNLAGTPPAPLVGVYNACGYSILVALGYGQLLWSTGETNFYIIVESGGAYSVTQTLNGCTSAPATLVADPDITPPPTISVVNHCGYSVLTAGNYTGSLKWSNGSTSSSITVTTAGVYSVRQTVNDCSSASTSATAAPKPIPSAPTVTVVNYCGYSVLTASGTGSFLWSNGATTPSITVAAAGTYTVRATLNGCTGPTRSATAAPKTIPVAPVVTVANYCGYSVLTASSYTGAIIWNTGVTTASITVNSVGTYSVTQSINGCTSPARTATAAPKALPPTPVVTVTNYCGYSVLTASQYTGSIHWNNGASTPSITVYSNGTYTVRQTLNGCTSLAGSGTAAPKAIPSAPTVTVVNNCNGSSLLTAGQYTGALSWSNGASTPSITVYTSATFTVYQTVNGCTSASGSGTSSPKSTPSAPVISVSNYCGNSVLTASGYTGALQWSNGATTASITVTSGGTYTLTQTVNGCTSLPRSAIAAPMALPATPVITVDNNCGNTILTANGATGALLWSNGATTPSITVYTAGTYTLKQLLNGCWSATASAYAAPGTTPPTPNITVNNLCGSSVLTATGYTGSLLWSNGATTASITVTNAATYTVRQTVGECISAARSANSLPLALPATPTISASGVTTFCQGGSVTLTSSSPTGNQWSTGATTQSIVVNASGNYTVRYTGSNGCQSLYSLAKAVMVIPKPVLSSGLTKTTTSGLAFSYTPTSTTTGSTFTWTRSTAPGISNPSASGSGAINEILVNTTYSSVNVTYVYTITGGGCTNTQNVVVTVAPAPIACSMNSAITTNFNSTTIPAGRHIWMSSVFDPGGLPTTGAVNFYVTNSRITVTISGYTSVIDIPDSRIRFDANVTSAITQYINNTWETQVPLNFSGNVFFGGLSYYIPYTLYGPITNLTWSATISSDRAGVTIGRKWGAAVYSNFAGNSGLAIKAVDGNIQNPYANTDKAGTPENYKSYLQGGGTGNGGSNYTGDYSATVNNNCTGLLTRQSDQQAGRQAESEEPEPMPVEKSPEVSLSVKIMPNPSTNYFNLFITSSNKSPVMVRILDIFGRVVEKHQGLSHNAGLQFGHSWSGGTYFAEISQGDQRKLVKIIKAN